MAGIVRFALIMSLFIFVGVAAVVAGPMVASHIERTIYKNVRLDMTIVTGGDTISASGIYGLRIRPKGNGYEIEDIGQALSFERGTKPPIFMLVGRQIQYDFPDLLLAGCKIRAVGVNREELFERLRNFTGPCDIISERLPTFVTFDRPADPYSIKILPPSLARTDPESLSVVKATFTASDRPYVPALDHLFQLLPWLQHAVAEEGLIWGPDPRRNPIKQEVYSAEFAKEKF